MKKLSILIIAILLFSTITMNEVKSISSVEIINMTTTSGSFGYMQGSICDFGFQLRNNTTSSQTATTSVLVYSSFTTYLNISFEDTLEPSEILDKPSFQFNVAETGNITIEITNSFDSKTYNIVSYKFYKQSFTTNEDKFYAGQELISTCQMVNKGDSRAFKINLVLKDPQNVIRQTQTKTATVPNEGILECTLNYIFLDGDRVGRWSVEMEISPELHPNLKLPIETLPIDFAQPTIDLVIEAPTYFTIGEDAQFAFTIKNESDINIFIPQIQVEIETMTGKGMFTDQVRCEINDVLKRYLYNITLLPEGNVGSEIKYTVDINLDASLKNEFTDEKWWKAGEYKIVVTVKTSVGSFLPYSNAIEIRSVTPLIEPSLLIKQPIYLIRGRTEPITVYFQFENLTEFPQPIGTIYLYIEPPAGDVTVKPERIQNIYLSKRRVSGCIYYDHCDFHPAKTAEGSIISGIYKLYFFLDAELEDQLTDPLEIRIEEKEYSRKLNLSVTGVETTYPSGSMISASVIVTNVGVQREDYALYVEIRKSTGDLELKMLLSSPQVSIEAEETQELIYNIPTKGVQGYIPLGYKTINFYIVYSVDGKEKREEVPFSMEITAQKGLNFAMYDINYKVSPRTVVRGQEVSVEVTIRNLDERISFFEVEIESGLTPTHDKQGRNIPGLTDATDHDPNVHTFTFSLQAVNEALDSPIKIIVNGQTLPRGYVTIRETPSPGETPPPSEMSTFEFVMYAFIIGAILLLLILVFIKVIRKGKKEEKTEGEGGN